MLGGAERQLLAPKTRRMLAVLALLIPLALLTTVFVTKRWVLSSVERGFFFPLCGEHKSKATKRWVDNQHGPDHAVVNPLALFTIHVTYVGSANPQLSRSETNRGHDRERQRDREIEMKDCDD